MEAITKSFGDIDAEKNPFDTPNIHTSFISSHFGNNPDYIPCEIEELKKVLEEKLHEYNDSKPAMPLVLFLQAM